MSPATVRGAASRAAVSAQEWMIERELLRAHEEFFLSAWARHRVFLA